ncbi:phytochelatin synthase [Burkholderia sp. Nafp2/4-1b]|nr:phytochelatin synthase [Burkholderia sp. Nafp2/4-1b]
MYFRSESHSYLKPYWPSWFAASLVAVFLTCVSVDNARASIAKLNEAAVALAPACRQIGSDGRLQVPSNLIALTQPEGQQRLLDTSAKHAYWPLSAHFETQQNQAYCSIATSVIALNALGIQRPQSTQCPYLGYFTQNDFFESVNPQLASATTVAQHGMTLEQLGMVLENFPVKVQRFYADDMTLTQFRTMIHAAVSRSDQFVLLNFKRSIIGEAGGGHWSPLAAYDESSDSALLLDVARYKYPPVWVPIKQLYQGAVAIDDESGFARGALIVSKR